MNFFSKPYWLKITLSSFSLLNYLKCKKKKLFLLFNVDIFCKKEKHVKNSCLDEKIT